MQSTSLSHAEGAEGMFLNGERLQLESRSTKQTGGVRKICCQMGKYPTLPKAQGVEVNPLGCIHDSLLPAVCVYGQTHCFWVDRGILSSRVLSSTAAPREYR